MVLMFDLTSLWAFYQKNKQSAGQALVGILLFAAGWQLGHVMSPYYAAHPIVFSDNARQAVGGSQQELVALQKEGKDMQAQAAAKAAPAVAGIRQEGAAPAEALAKAGFVASVNSTLYHHPDCPTAKRIKDVNQVWFASQAEAEAAGYSPSKCTLDKLSKNTNK